MKNFKVAALVVVTLAAVNAPAFAASLSPGGVIFTNGITVGSTIQDPVARPELAGVVQNDNLIPFSFDPTPTTPFNNVGGNVQNRVVRNSDGNLIFAPRIRDTYNIDGGTLSIVGFSLQGYGDAATDVDFRLDGLGDKGFSSVSRSVDGDRMTFRYDDPLLVDAINPPGRQETSHFPSILTDAAEYDLSGTMTIFGRILPLAPFGVERVSAFDDGDEGGRLFRIEVSGLAVPTSPSEVPLPASSLLLLGGLAAMTRLRKRS